MDRILILTLIAVWGLRLDAAPAAADKFESPALTNSTKIKLVFALNYGKKADRIDRIIQGVQFNGSIPVVSDNSGVYFFNRVPHLSGYGYGWIVKVTSPGITIKLKEVITAPAIATWRYNDPIRGHVEVKSRVHTKVEEFELENGVASNGWEIAKDDPIGTYNVKVYFQDTLILDYNFKIQTTDDFLNTKT